MTDFPHLLTALTRAGVEFIIVGGFAATAHGSAHVTVDLDVVYRRTSDNLRRLVRALAPLGSYLRGAPPGLPFQFDIGTIRRGLDFTLVTAAGDTSICSARLQAAARPRPCCRTRSRGSCSISSVASSISIP